MGRTLIVGNWKMNGALASNLELLSDIARFTPTAGSEICVCAPALYVSQCKEILQKTPICWGAQDMSFHQAGAFTGEISADMFAEMGCRYIIVGHSERRSNHGETSEIVSRKAARVLESRMTPIVCVGETLIDRECNNTEAVINSQIGAVIAALSPDELKEIVIAYEPVWAIGTGKTATPQMAQAVHEMIRTQIANVISANALDVKILYGGSMKPDNSKELMSMPDIDGGLIGGASLKSTDFLAIAASA